MEQELSLSTRFLVENREYEIKWGKDAREDEICTVCQYILNDILKVYSSDSVILKDHELQQYSVKDIVSFQMKEIFVYLPHKKEIRTFVNSEVREFRNVFHFLSSEKIKIEKFKQKQIKMESVFMTLAIIRKQNQGFEQILQQLIQSRLNNASISGKSPLNSSENNHPSASSPLPQQSQQPKPQVVEAGQGNFPEDSEQEQPPSPKFGAVTQTDSEKITNNNFTGSPSLTSPPPPPPPSGLKLGAALLKAPEVNNANLDLKNRNKVAGMGTQQDYLRNQQHQTPNEIKGYTMNEVAQHKTDSDAWTVIHGKIYDVTHYLHYHPGGKDKLMLGAGRDGTELFQKYHPWVNAHYILQKNQIGFVVMK